MTIRSNDGKVIHLPAKASPYKVTPADVWAEPAPSDEEVWAICPYLRNLRDCDHCAASEKDADNDEPVVRGCRAITEECVRTIHAMRRKKEEFGL